jgi:hypothetical protein
MAADPFTILKEEVVTWSEEMRTLLGSCRMLVEYWGSDDEPARWDAAVALPLEWIVAVVDDMPPRGPPFQLPNHDVRATFVCSESTARVISPLVEILGGPVTDFIYTIRQTIPSDDQKAFTRAYGGFVGAFADAVAWPLWRAHRRLAPAEWLAANPDSA